MTLKTPLLGPIVGHTTATTLRLWIKGQPNTLGVARIREEGGAFRTPQTFALHPHFDWIGITEFAELNPATRYEYQIGCMDPSDSPDIVWPATDNPDRVTTFPDHSASGTSFITGSCQDPWRLKGSRKSANATFGGVTAHLAGDLDHPIDFFLLLGDQIYVDHTALGHKLTNLLKPFWRSTERWLIPYSSFLKKYEAAYSRPNFSSLIRSYPTYMIYDDHEVQNNWSRSLFESDDAPEFHPKTYENGIRAYQAHQAALAPIPQITAGLSSNGDASPVTENFPVTDHGYEFNHGDCQFFVLDVRGERERQSEEANMIGAARLEALKNWLDEHRDDWKFIVSPVPMFPDTHRPAGGRDDIWAGYPKQRHDILEFIRTEGIKRTIVVSGDIHISCVAKLRHESDPDFVLHNVIASAFHWLAPGLQRFHIHAPGRLVYRDATRRSERTDSLYHAELRSKGQNSEANIIKQNNFTKVTVSSDGSCVTVSHFDDSGSEIGSPVVIED